MQITVQYVQKVELCSTNVVNFERMHNFNLQMNQQVSRTKIKIGRFLKPCYCLLTLILLFSAVSLVFSVCRSSMVLSRSSCSLTSCLRASTTRPSSCSRWFSSRSPFSIWYTWPHGNVNTWAEISTPDARVEISMPDAWAEISTPDAWAEISTSDERAEISMPDARVEISMPDARAEISTPDEWAEISTPDMWEKIFKCLMREYRVFQSKNIQCVLPY